MDDFAQMFREEAQELLNQLEDKLMDMEKYPNDRERISAVFRTIHTIKGSSSMFGFDHITEFTHRIENTISALREGKIPLTRRLIDLTLEARDLILLMLSAEEEEMEPALRKAETLGLEFLKIDQGERSGDSPEPGTGPAEEPPVPILPQDLPEEEKTWRVRIPSWNEAFERGVDPLRVIKSLRTLGECLVQPGTEGLPDLASLDLGKSYLSWDVLLTTRADENQIRDLFFFQENEAPVSVTLLSGPGDLEGLETKKIGEILVERGLLSKADIDQALTRNGRLGEVLVEEKLVKPQQLQAVLDEQSYLKQMKEKKQDGGSSLRVNAGKLDELVDLVGEMVTAQARLNQLVQGHPELAAQVEHMERLTTALRQNTMSLRMLPIESAFQRFHRTVRQLAAELGKDVDLEISGGETELDKSILDRLGEPLLHLVRNAVDHGIEKPEVREKAGKSPRGKIALSAFHSGDAVHISIKDDGKGLDAGALRRRGIEMGLLQSDRPYSDQDLYQIIFQPGFSTSAVVTQVSGRGVGMDVVKKEIDSLGGVIKIATHPGQGTDFELTLPLTLAIIEGLLVSVAGSAFILPLTNVEACLDWREVADKDLSQRQLMEFRDRVIPFVILREYYELGDQGPEEQQVVVVGTALGSVGVVVDEVIGGHQTVIKKLGKIYAGIPGLAGASVLGDGSLALILDAAVLRGDRHA